MGGQQRPTAGWLAALPVFEPHWQVRHCVIVPTQPMLAADAVTLVFALSCLDVLYPAEAIGLDLVT